MKPGMIWSYSYFPVSYASTLHGEGIGSYAQCVLYTTLHIPVRGQRDLITKLIVLHGTRIIWCRVENSPSKHTSMLCYVMFYIMKWDFILLIDYRYRRICHVESMCRHTCTVYLCLIRTMQHALLGLFKCFHYLQQFASK